MVSPSRCPPWQPERPGPTRREPRRAQRSYTTPRDTIAELLEHQTDRARHAFVRVDLDPPVPSPAIARRQGEPELAATGCCSARGLGADRRGNVLILLDCEGSTKHAQQQAGLLSACPPKDVAVLNGPRVGPKTDAEQQFAPRRDLPPTAARAAVLRGGANSNGELAEDASSRPSSL